MNMDVSAIDAVPAEVVVEGRLDAVEAVSLRETLGALVDSGQHRIAVDLSSSEFIDSAGLAALVKYMKDARQSGGDLRLVRPRSADARRVFSLTKFDEVFHMADDLDSLTSEW